MQKWIFLVVMVMGLGLVTKKYAREKAKCRKAESVISTLEQKEKIVVITGATRGLGRALVKQFVCQGWRVVGCGTSTETISNLQKEYGTDHYFCVVNVTDNNAVKAWSQEVISRMGTPAILINNAGVINNPAPLWEIPLTEFNNVISINVIGVFNVLQHFVSLMLQQKKGLIINISSSSGKEGEAKLAPYCASKFAIEGLTKSLAQELPKGVTAVSLDPGDGINTDMLKQAYQGIAQNHPEPDAWAKKAVPYILSINDKDNGKSLVVR